MVCAHLPGAAGSDAARQSWRLLKLACRTHRTHVAAMAGRRVTLADWRAVARRTQTLAMTPRSRWFGRQRFNQQVRDLARRQRYQLVLCDDPALWPLIDHVRAAVRACIANDDDHRLPPDVLRLSSQSAWEQLIDQLAPPPPIEVVVAHPLPLRRAA